MSEGKLTAMDRINARVAEVKASKVGTPEVGKSKEDLKNSFLEIAKARVKAKQQVSPDGEEIDSTADQLPDENTPDMTANPASAADPLDALFEQQYSDPDVDLYEVFGRVDIGQKGADRLLYCFLAPISAIPTVRTYSLGAVQVIGSSSCQSVTEKLLLQLTCLILSASLFRPCTGSSSPSPVLYGLQMLAYAKGWPLLLLPRWWCSCHLLSCWHPPLFWHTTVSFVQLANAAVCRHRPS